MCMGDTVDKARFISMANTQAEAIENLREYFKETNEKILTINDVPDCIRELATRNLDRNADLDITVREDGVVFVDGQGPEMDYFTITLTE